MSFVLRLLLGYTAETSAQILGIERSEIAFLIADAAAQFGNQLPTHLSKSDADLVHASSPTSKLNRW
jgi:hypothetical protein